jgi:hypothetical protein
VEMSVKFFLAFQHLLVSNEIVSPCGETFLVRGSKFYPADKSHALLCLA